MDERIFVYFDAETSERPIPMGTLFVARARGNEVFSFEYESDWLRAPAARALDPHLALYAGRQYVPADKTNFGIFLDSSPDRWGRVLLRRRESLRAREENRRERRLTETDFLLGVFDGSRMGALRFKRSPDANFLDDDSDAAIPPWASLRELAFASTQLERDELGRDGKTARWLKMLVAPGSSLGGARPKATTFKPTTANFGSQNFRAATTKRTSAPGSASSRNSQTPAAYGRLPSVRKNSAKTEPPFSRNASIEPADGAFISRRR